MPQLLLIPDPRPLVERFGVEFFRKAPQCPGVYLMRDSKETVLYVGKAKNLRRRLVSYRVANPDRLPRRHLRLLRAVARIELQECADESAALAKESELLRQLRPRFNRAGTWPGTPRFLKWTSDNAGLHLEIRVEAGPGSRGPFGGGLIPFRAALLRLLWCAVHPEQGIAAMPHGWFAGRHGEIATIFRTQANKTAIDEAMVQLEQLFEGVGAEFVEYIRARTPAARFEVAAREADLESVIKFCAAIPISRRD